MRIAPPAVNHRSVAASVFVVVCLSLCLSACLSATLRKNFRIFTKFSGKVDNGPMSKYLNFGGDPDHRLDIGIVFWIRHYWEIRKVVSTDCAARRCSARHALAGIAIATMTSLRHQTLAEVCAVPVLLGVEYFVCD